MLNVSVNVYNRVSILARRSIPSSKREPTTAIISFHGMGSKSPITMMWVEMPQVKVVVRPGGGSPVWEQPAAVFSCGVR